MVLLIFDVYKQFLQKMSEFDVENQGLGYPKTDISAQQAATTEIKRETLKINLK